MLDDPDNVNTATKAVHSVFSHTAEIAWVVLAMIGGAARYLDKFLRTGNRPQMWPLFANVFVSGFSGYMAAQVVIRFSAEWAVVAAGVGGYLGTQALDWAATILAEKFGGSIPHRSNDDDKRGAP